VGRGQFSSVQKPLADTGRCKAGVEDVPPRLRNGVEELFGGRWVKMQLLRGEAPKVVLCIDEVADDADAGLG
jgi:hypothetical protein